MFSLEGFFIGDVWPFLEEGTVHLYCLLAPRSDPEKHWSIGHLTSRDLEHWEFHGIALAPGAPGSFDDLKLATGSILKHGGRYYMAYTGHGRQDPIRCGAAGMAVSDDLFHWEKLSPVIRPDGRFYETEITGSRDFLHWRDPFLLEEDGVFHMFLCARSKTGGVKTRGAVAHLTSGDLLAWEAHAPLDTEPFCEELECPQIYRVDGSYLLLFCTHPELIDPARKPPGGGGFAMTADKLAGPYRRPLKIEIDHGHKYFYAPQLLRFHGRYFLIGTVLDGDESFIAVHEATVENGILRPLASN